MEHNIICSYCGKPIDSKKDLWIGRTSKNKWRVSPYHNTCVLKEDPSNKFNLKLNSAFSNIIFFLLKPVAIIFLLYEIITSGRPSLDIAVFFLIILLLCYGIFLRIKWYYRFEKPIGN